MIPSLPSPAPSESTNTLVAAQRCAHVDIQARIIQKASVDELSVCLGLSLSLALMTIIQRCVCHSRPTSNYFWQDDWTTIKRPIVLPMLSYSSLRVLRTCSPFPAPSDNSGDRRLAFQTGASGAVIMMMINHNGHYCLSTAASFKTCELRIASIGLRLQDLSGASMEGLHISHRHRDRMVDMTCLLR